MAGDFLFFLIFFGLSSFLLGVVFKKLKNVSSSSESNASDVRSSTFNCSDSTIYQQNKCQMNTKATDCKVFSARRLENGDNSKTLLFMRKSSFSRHCAMKQGKPYNVRKTIIQLPPPPTPLKKTNTRQEIIFRNGKQYLCNI